MARRAPANERSPPIHHSAVLDSPVVDILLNNAEHSSVAIGEWETHS